MKETCENIWSSSLPENQHRPFPHWTYEQRFTTCHLNYFDWVVDVRSKQRHKSLQNKRIRFHLLYLHKECVRSFLCFKAIRRLTCFPHCCVELPACSNAPQRLSMAFHHCLLHGSCAQMCLEQQCNQDHHEHLQPADIERQRVTPTTDYQSEFLV